MWDTSGNLFLPQEPLAWATDAVKNVIPAHKMHGKGNRRLPNFIRSDIVLQILIRDSRDRSFAQMAYISPLYALRAPSEALLLRRAFRNDELTSFAPMKAPPLVAIRGDKPIQCIFMRLLRRKNLPRGCILSRPCFCRLSGPRDKQLCPFHAIWPAIAARVRPGDLLFPGYYGENANTTIKAVLAKIGIAYARSYTCHGFRRGDAQELE